MTDKKIPIRTCIVCRNEFAKKDLFRIVKSNENEISLDKTGKKNGRGAYICKNADCFDKLVKNKTLNRAFKMQVEDSVYQAIKEDFLGTAK